MKILSLSSQMSPYDETKHISAEKQKNEHGEAVVNKILNDAHWMNIHELPVSWSKIIV